MTRDLAALAALARTLEALRALHACPLCHGSGETRDDYDAAVPCSVCSGCGIAALRAEDDAVSAMRRATESMDRVLGADVAALVAKLHALTARVRLCEDTLRGVLARLDAADPSPEVAFPEPQRRDVRGSVVETRTAPPFEVELTPELLAAGERVLA